MPVVHPFRRRHLEHTVVPLHVFRPAEPTAHRPLPPQRGLDRRELRIGQTGGHIPRLDPVQLETHRPQSSRAVEGAIAGTQAGIESRAVGELSLRTNPVAGEAFPEVGEEPAVIRFARDVVGCPVEELDAQLRAASAARGQSVLHRAGHREHRTGAAVSLRTALEPPAFQVGAQIDGGVGDRRLRDGLPVGREGISRRAVQRDDSRTCPREATLENPAIHSAAPVGDQSDRRRFLQCLLLATAWAAAPPGFAQLNGVLRSGPDRGAHWPLVRAASRPPRESSARLPPRDNCFAPAR